MEPRTVDEYRRAGCPTIAKMLAVHYMTGGQICDTGCAAYRHGRCPHYLKLVGEPQSSENRETPAVHDA